MIEATAESPRNRILAWLREEAPERLFITDARARIYLTSFTLLFFELLANGAFNLRRTVAGVQAANSAGKVEKLVAVHVFDHRAFGTRGKNGSGMIRPARHGGLAALH